MVSLAQATVTSTVHVNDILNATLMYLFIISSNDSIDASVGKNFCNNIWEGFRVGTRVF